MSPLLAVSPRGMITFILPVQLGIRILHTCHSNSQSWKKTSSGAWVHISSYSKHSRLPSDNCGIFTQQVVCPGTPAFNSLMSCFHCTPNTLISSFASHLWIQNFYLIKTWLASLFSMYLLLGREPNSKSWSLLGTDGDPCISTCTEQTSHSPPLPVWYWADVFLILPRLFSLCGSHTAINYTPVAFNILQREIRKS